MYLCWVTTWISIHERNAGQKEKFKKQETCKHGRPRVLNFTLMFNHRIWGSQRSFNVLVFSVNIKSYHWKTTWSSLLSLNFTFLIFYSSLCKTSCERRKKSFLWKTLIHFLNPLFLSNHKYYGPVNMKDWGCWSLFALMLNHHVWYSRLQMSTTCLLSKFLYMIQILNFTC